MAVDHDKKKVVISIRGTLSPKVRCPVTQPTPWTPSQPPRVPASFFLFSVPPLTVLSPHKDALTDLTGDAERLPVEGHHGTWLGHKVPLLVGSPGGPWPSPLRCQHAGLSCWGGGSSGVTGLTRRDWSERCGFAWKVHCPTLARTPTALPGADPIPQELKEATGKRSHWFLLGTPSL